MSCVYDTAALSVHACVTRASLLRTPSSSGACTASSHIIELLAAYDAALDEWLAPLDEAIEQAQAERNAATAAAAEDHSARAVGHLQQEDDDDTFHDVQPVRERYATIEARQQLIADAGAYLNSLQRESAKPEEEQTYEVQHLSLAEQLLCACVGWHIRLHCAGLDVDAQRHLPCNHAQLCGAG